MVGSPICRRMDGWKYLGGIGRVSALHRTGSMPGLCQFFFKYLFSTRLSCSRCQRFILLTTICRCFHQPKSRGRERRRFTYDGYEGSVVRVLELPIVWLPSRSLSTRGSILLSTSDLWGPAVFGAGPVPGAEV